MITKIEIESRGEFGKENWLSVFDDNGKVIVSVKANMEGQTVVLKSHNAKIRFTELDSDITII